MILEVKCPYCGEKQKHCIVAPDEQNIAWKPVMLCCDIEAGGCDKRFAITVKLTPSVTVFRLEEVKE